MSKQLGNWRRPLNFWTFVGKPIFALKYFWRFITGRKDVATTLRNWLLLTPILIIGLLFSWMIVFVGDTLLLTSENESHRNIQITYIDVPTGNSQAIHIGGLSSEEIQNRLEELWAEQGQESVRLTFPDEFGVRNLTTTIGNLGVEIDVDATTDAILETRRGQNVLRQVISWSRSFFDSDKVAVQYSFAAPIDINLDLPFELRQAQSASFTQMSPTAPLVLVPEIIGSTIDEASIRNTVFKLASQGFPINIEVSPSEIYPAIRNREMNAAIQTANSRTAVGLDVVVDGKARRLSAEDYRKVFSYEFDIQTQTLISTIDKDILQQNIEMLFAGKALSNIPINDQQIQALISGENTLIFP